MVMWDRTSDLQNCIQASTFSLYLTSPFHVKPSHSGASERYPIVIKNKKKQDFDFWLDKPNVKDLTITGAKSTSVVGMRCQETDAVTGRGYPEGSVGLPGDCLTF